MRKLIAAAFAAILTGSAAGGEIVTSTGIVDQIETGTGQVKIALSGIDQIFGLTTDQSAGSNAAVAAIRDSEVSHNSVSLSVDLASARIDAATRRPIFQISGVTYRGINIAVPAAARPPGRSKAWETDLAAGLALQQDGRSAEARVHLDRALADDRLARDLRGMGFRARAASQTEAAAGLAPEPTTEGDRLLVLALADNRAWQQVEPDSVMAALAVADARQELGDFDGSLADYAKIVARWPETDTFVGVRRGAIYRRMGNYDRALAELDAITASHGRQEGMRFHYHRGWTLNKLGRYDEAIVELSEGLDYQPDYAWALVKRACAFGQVGRLVDAARDMRRAADLALQQPDAAPTPESRAQRAWLADVASQLEKSAAATQTGNSDAACGSAWPGSEGNRARSPLLDQPTT